MNDLIQIYQPYTESELHALINNISDGEGLPRGFEDIFGRLLATISARDIEINTLRHEARR